MAQLAVRDPAADLTILSENVGSVSSHGKHIVDSLLLHAPHVYFLQEARLTAGELRGWHARARNVGYLAHLDEEHHLLTFWRRGLNLAPVAAPEGTQIYRASHYALQLKRARVLLRSVHYCNGTSASRNSMHLALRTTCTSMCFFLRSVASTARCLP